MSRVQVVNLFYSPQDKNYVFRFIILKTDLILSGRRRTWKFDSHDSGIPPLSSERVYNMYLTVLLYSCHHHFVEKTILYASRERANT